MSQTLSTISLIILVYTVLSNAVLAVFVFKNNPKSATNKIFAALAVIISLWIIAMHVSYAPPFSLLLIRGTLFLALPMNLLLFLLAHTLPFHTLQLKERYLVLILGLVFATMMLTLTPYTFSDLEVINETPKPVGKPGLAVFGMVSIGLIGSALYLLFKKLRTSTGMEHRQFLYVLWGVLSMFGLIIATVFLPVLIFDKSVFVPFAPLYSLLFLGFTSYAVLKHRLLEVRFILIRAVAFLAFIVICAAIYGALLFVVVQKTLGLEIEQRSAIVALILIVVSSITFQPILGLINRLTNSIFFKDRYDADHLLSSLTREMAQTIELEKMTTRLLEILTAEMRVSKGAFIILNGTKPSTIIVRGYVAENFKKFNTNVLFSSSTQQENYFLFEDLAESPLKKAFRTANITAALPIKVGPTKMAVLVLGPKLSGEIYESRDTDVLTIFSSEAGIAIQNAKSYAEIKLFSKVLEKRVEERTRELKETQKRELAKAQDIAKLKDEFVFVAAHELRTPVTAIRGFMQLVTPAVKTFPKDVQENLSFIGAASDHLNQLVNDLLQVSRSESGSLKVAVLPVHLAPLITALLKEVDPQARARNIKVIVNVPAERDTALVDEGKIKEVIMNLLSNAVKYNKDAGQVTVTLEPTGKMLAFSVKDTGYGIPKDQQEKIFQKFFRAQSKQTEEILGTGLGLFLTRMLVEKMGGTISFTSQEGEGSTFKVSLPAPLA